MSVNNRRYFVHLHFFGYGKSKLAQYIRASYRKYLCAYNRIVLICDNFYKSSVYAFDKRLTVCTHKELTYFCVFDIRFLFTYRSDFGVSVYA